uniref:Uncharacterized protein n=1 Tax=Rhizophora mucronata TaxID=61149 RepID=A0A2P2PCQ3_RHIMU
MTKTWMQSINVTFWHKSNDSPPMESKIVRDTDVS